MVLNDEQFKALTPYESYFDTAVNSSWSRHPGQSALRVIYDTYTAATHDRRRLNSSCQYCVLHLLQDCGRVYFADKEERAAKMKAKTKRKPCSTI